MKLIRDVIRGLIKESQETELATYREFHGWLDGVLPKLIHKYMLRSQAMKVCSTISPEFAEIAKDAGFVVGSKTVPGHVFNVVLTSDGPFMVDLSYIQFTCKHDLQDKGSRAEVVANFKALRQDPWRAVKIEKLDSVPHDITMPDGKMMFDPVSSFKQYDPDETEDDYAGWFNKIK